MPLAIRLIEQGDSMRAALELTAVLAEQPNNQQAAYFLGQIQSPLDRLYPAENFTVQLKQDESLSSLAAAYLGDSRAFYGLARYNGIGVPARVAAGQAIRIPSTPRALAARASLAMMVQPASMMSQGPPPQEELEAVRDPWTAIRGAVAEGRYEAAIRVAEAARIAPDGMQAVVLAAAYAGNAKALRTSNPAQAHAQALKAGQLYLETASRPEDALEPLLLAVAINPDDSLAQALLGSARSKAADPYYREGVAAERRQDLDAAIDAFDRVLTIDPRHENAQLHRAAAIDLRQRLRAIRGQP